VPEPPIFRMLSERRRFIVAPEYGLGRVHGGNHMKKFLVAGIAAVAFYSAPALAADMPVKAPVYKAAAEPMFNWSGFYVGGHAGYGWEDVKWENIGTSGFFSPIGSTFDNSPKGALGGVQVGFNWQNGVWVFGVEGSFSWGDLNKTSTSPSLSSPTTDNFSSKISNIYTVTGRVGFNNGPWLPYVKAGFAGADVKTAFMSTRFLGVVAEASRQHTGWTVGAGLEYLLSPNWSVGLEYNFIDLSTKTHDMPDIVAGVPSGVIQNYAIDPRIQTIMLKINYKFGDWGKAPVVAKY
jgi:outer membrane immunogenic protein